MAMNGIDYNKAVDEVMHLIVHKVLKQVEQEGLPGNHHFFISFLTSNKGVKISNTLRNKYPYEMTIVLQYQFHNLKVDPNGFSVMLNFGGIPEEIYIPFDSMIAFVDPSVQFGLQFNNVIFNEQEDIEDMVFSFLEEEENIKQDLALIYKDDHFKVLDKDASDNVVMLEKFRKNNSK